MFLTSTLVPSSVAAGRTQRHVGVDAERALLHLHVGDADRLQDAAQLVHVCTRLLRAAEVGPAHDLHERDAGAVVVDQRVIGFVDAPAASDVDGLAGVLLHVRALDADTESVDLERSVDADRLVVLADLIVLRHVRVEVVLPVEHRAVRDRALQRLADAQRELHRPLAEHRQRAGQPQAHRADVRVGLGAELVLARAEQLRRRGQLDVHLEADHRLPRRGGRGGHARLPPCPNVPIRARSRSSAARCATACRSRTCTRASAARRSCSSTATRRPSASGGATSRRSPTPASR